jgi:hypothetical protein
MFLSSSLLICNYSGVILLVTEGKCSLKINHGQHILYLKTKMATDSNFPFPLGNENNKYSARYIKVSFNNKKQLIIEDWTEKPKQ